MAWVDSVSTDDMALVRFSANMSCRGEFQCTSPFPTMRLLPFRTSTMPHMCFGRGMFPHSWRLQFVCYDHVYESRSLALISTHKLRASRRPYSRRCHRRCRCCMPNDVPGMEILYQEEKGTVRRK